MSARFDVGVIGAGVMGATTALFLARAGMRVVLIDRGELCREASGVNAGTLTLHMTRAALIPYAQAGWRMWMTADQWLGRGVDAVATDGLALAFTDAEVELLERRAAVRAGVGWGMVPDLQDPREALVVLHPTWATEVTLHWQVWRVASEALDAVTAAVVDAAASIR